jgi:hypothetical protein
MNPDERRDFVADCQLDHIGRVFYRLRVLASICQSLGGPRWLKLRLGGAFSLRSALMIIQFGGVFKLLKQDCISRGWS